MEKFLRSYRWFKNIRNKSNASFFVFEIESLYLSISLKLLDNAISFSKSICNISEQDMLIIVQARGTLLFNDGEPWVKKTGNEEFDVPRDVLMELKFVS